MKKYRRLIIAAFVLYLFIINQVTAIENKILFKVNDQIITSIDLLNEINYLSFVNIEFKKLDKQRMYEVSKNSLIREKIKMDLKHQFLTEWVMSMKEGPRRISRVLFLIESMKFDINFY